MESVMNCNGVKAIVRFKESNVQKEFVVPQKLQPIEITCFDGGEQIYSHKMTSPIQQDFPSRIISVSLVDPNDKYNKRFDDPKKEFACPIPSIQGNKLISFFDESGQSNVDWYSDNTGTCTYKVVLQQEFKILSGTRILYTSNKVNCRSITFACEDCPDGYIKCTHNKYPGYCCIPCQETAAKINNLAAKARCCNG